MLRTLHFNVLILVTLWVCLCCPSRAQPGKGPPPNLEGMPSFQQMQKQGPPWRQVASKVFTEACQPNRGLPTVFCFPNYKELIAGLLQAKNNGADFQSEMFLLDVHTVIEQLMSWPPSWPGVIDLLAKKYEWTKPFCDKIIGNSPIWHPVPFVRRSFIIPQQTMAQVSKTSPVLAASMQRWIDELQSRGDSKTKILLKDLRSNDTADVKNKRMHARPLMRLMQHEHAKVVKHVFGTACKSSSSVRAKLELVDDNGLTVLHHVASSGDHAGARAILKSLPKDRRSSFKKIRDKWGYTAEDWARIGNHTELISYLEGKSEAADNGDGPADPIKRFLSMPAETAKSRQQENSCRYGSGDLSATCSASESRHGGWTPPDLTAVPPEWMPPAEKPCFADTIDVEEFDFEVFASHYVLHTRPLLIRGGARLPQNIAEKFTRAGLLAAAGGRKVEAETFPGRKAYDGTKPLEKTVSKFVELLEEKSKLKKIETKNLKYLYTRIAEQEGAFEFVRTLPDILRNKVNLTIPSFYLGSRFMGAPPHVHGPSANSLIYGAKLWFFDPPGNELFVHETMYEYLKKTGGAPGSLRCLQEAGDLLFVPRMWTHGAICLGDCIGMSQEFTHGKWDLQDNTAR